MSVPYYYQNCRYNIIPNYQISLRDCGQRGHYYGNDSYNYGYYKNYSNYQFNQVYNQPYNYQNYGRQNLSIYYPYNYYQNNWTYTTPRYQPYVPYTQTYYYPLTEKYSSRSTDSTRHNNEAYHSYNDPTEGLIIDEDEYYYSNLYKKTDKQYSIAKTYTNKSINYNDGKSIAYYKETSACDLCLAQSGSLSFYRGNRSELLVFDKPFDIVAVSNSVKGGVAETYIPANIKEHTVLGIDSPVLAIGLFAIILIVGVIGYLFGKKKA